MEEIWKDIKRTNGYYEVSNLGRVRSWVRKNGRTGKRKKPNYLNPPSNSRGYKYVDIFGKQISIHRLVAIHFVDNPKKYNTVNHENGIKNDNRARNLEWGTIQYNISHACKNGLRGDLRGSKNGMAKLTEPDVIIIKRMIKTGFTDEDIANKFGMGKKSINNIRNKKSWTHV